MHEARKALKSHPACGAYCRTTGNSCRNPSMKNGRCRMHGGKSTGRPIIHGRDTKVKRAQYAESRKLLDTLKDMLADF
ncbi:MAG: HGGxSTG domain-containing protein [Alphaproteobacteria bacterium]